jgi:Ca2+-binding RTX toxin-like protein
MALIFGARTDSVINAFDGVTNDADTIVGDSGNESIYGLGGNDVLKGGGGADRLYGDDGIDTAVYLDSDAGVVISLTAGRGTGGSAHGDRLYSIENVTGSEHRDELYGDDNDNTLSGEGGDDLIKGGGGADQLLGGDGGDTLVADGLDFVDGGDGNDVVSFAREESSGPGLSHPGLGIRVDLSSGHFDWGVLSPVDRVGPPNIVNVENVAGTEGMDIITGNDVDNLLLGYGGFDRIRGGGGTDTIDGGDATDWIWGGAGNDHLWGGAGADEFHFERNDGTINLGHDVIYDFESGDRIAVDDTISFATVRAGMRQVGDDVVITFDSANSITLVDTRLFSVTSEDFLFV